MRWGAQLRYNDFSVPRWLIFIGMLVPVWWLGRAIIKVLVFIIEGAFFTQKRALYYIMGTKVICSSSEPPLHFLMEQFSSNFWPSFISPWTTQGCIQGHSNLEWLSQFHLMISLVSDQHSWTEAVQGDNCPTEAVNEMQKGQ